MRVHIVIPEPETKWILGKIACNLVEYANTEDIEVNTGSEVDPGADVNHFIPWWAAHGRLVPRSLLMVTHIEPNSRWEQIAHEILPKATYLTTMSRQTKERLESWGISPDRITVAPVGIDPKWQPRLISVGLVYRIYQDGRKGEGLLLELANSMDLSAFRFVLVGTGWGTIYEGLQERGIKADWYDTEDYAVHTSIVPHLDYWLYTAWDEGPLGMLDALRCGVTCILPPQGYCLDAAPYSYFYRDLGELLAIFRNIREERWRHRRTLDRWTWRNYGQLHQEIYRGVARSRGQCSE